MFSAELAHEWWLALHEFYKTVQTLYENVLRAGVLKELARLSVPFARYSRMRASANLRNWLQFLMLRFDSTAQWEIREYAHRVAHCVRQCFPFTYEVFAAYGDK